ncbi:DUF4145 domain-containing protein [Acinetobacter guillouiae]|uniref:DUF4145 domain-containing protein n=1 Tax=Acinetobacter guillouiae TaxID=106649 RepID=UPI003AF61308
MGEIQKIKTQCFDCQRETNHLVIASKLYDFESNNYRYGKEYSIVQCLGCDHTSFLQTFHDYEVRYPVEEIWTSEGMECKYDYDKGYTNFYPDAQEVLRKLQTILPNKLFEIYSETKKAYIQNLDIFTAIGIRSIIECICNDKGVKGKNLAIQISNLKNLGNISKVDIEMLHSLRFLGNDAVHAIIKTKRKDLGVAFKIVDHLIATIYIMPKELEDTNFKKHLGDFESFESYVQKMFESLESTQIKTIIGILEPNVRMDLKLLNNFEKELQTKIKSGDISWLEIADSSDIQNVFYKKKPA